MERLVELTKKNFDYTKIIEWARLLTVTATAQITIQVIGLISGILVVRLLPTQEYALYTLANTMLGTMTMLADGGIASGVMAQAGKVWQDDKKVGAVLVTGLELRKKFAVGSLFITVPILLYLFILHGINWYIAILIAGCLIPSFFSSLSGTLYEVAPKLRQDLKPLQKNQITISIARLIIIIATLFLFPVAFIAILGAGLPQIWGNLKLKKISALYADWHQKPDDEIRKNILKNVKRILPGAIYYCLSCQIAVWMVSLLGSTTSVAQMGALNRLVLVLSFVTTIITILIVPRFARLQAIPKLLSKKFFQIQAALCFLSVLIVTASWLFSGQIVSILGKNYSNLTYEVVLTAISGCATFLNSGTYLLNSSRGIVIHPLISIPSEILLIVVLIFILPLNTLTGVICLSIAINGLNYLMQLGNFLFANYRNRVQVNNNAISSTLKSVVNN